jgi:hypothetical protein
MCYYALVCPDVGPTLTAKRDCKACGKLTGEWDIEWPTLLRLVRVVARHSAYRERVHCLLERLPEDVWYDRDLGWSVTYLMSEDRTLSFVVEGPPEVTGASRVTRVYECKEL